VVEKIRAVKGMHDVRPGAAETFLDTAWWNRIFATAERVLESAGYRRVYLPVVEETALFTRGIGEATDIVSKEMYSFSDRGERQLTLRPEGTAGAARAYVEHNLAATDPVQRWWYAGPMYRAERPQKGRYREFYQIGAELFGAASPASDAEMIGLVWALTRALGIDGVTVRLNTLGDPPSRAAYREALQGFLRGRKSELCDSCAERIETNPLRVLDCKRPQCREVVKAAPDIAASLSPEARGHFDAVQQLLEAQRVPYTRDSHLVRGLDYYTGTLFELTTTALGAQDAILGGGRYDNLVQELGGAPTPSIGFAAGVERLALVLSEKEKAPWSGPHLYIVPMGGAETKALTLAAETRAEGPWRVEVDVSGGKLKQQMKRADRSGALLALVLGESELTAGQAKLKDLLAATETPLVELTGSALCAAIATLVRERGEVRR
jgi:histidyl-tRNA synthetase